MRESTLRVGFAALLVVLYQPGVAGGRERRQQIVVEVREHDLLHADDVGRGGDELREQRSAPGRPGPRGRIDVRVLGVLAVARQVAVGQNVPLPGRVENRQKRPVSGCRAPSAPMQIKRP